MLPAELRETRIAAIHHVVAALRAIPEQITPDIITRCTPGLMSREMRLRAGECVASKVHLREHQFVIAAGKCYVASDTESVLLEAGHVGSTCCAIAASQRLRQQRRPLRPTRDS